MQLNKNILKAKQKITKFTDRLLENKYFFFLKELHDYIVKFRIFDSSAQIAYYLVLSFFPFVLIMFYLIPLIPIPGIDILELFKSIIPGYLLPVFTSLFSNLKNVSSSILPLSILLAFFSASTGINVIIQVINRIFKQKQKKFFLIDRILSIGLTFAFSVVIFISIFFYVFFKNVVLFIDNFTNTSLSSFLPIFSYLIIPIAIFLIFSLLYYIAIPEKLKFSTTIIGSLVSTLFLLLSFKGLYAYFSFSSFYTSTYGLLGAFIILILYFYALAIIILLGVVINKIVYDRRHKN